VDERLQDDLRQLVRQPQVHKLQAEFDNPLVQLHIEAMQTPWSLVARHPLQQGLELPPRRSHLHAAGTMDVDVNVVRGILHGGPPATVVLDIRSLIRRSPVRPKLFAHSR